jgi:hypothetical protein
MALINLGDDRQAVKNRGVIPYYFLLSHSASLPPGLYSLASWRRNSPWLLQRANRAPSYEFPHIELVSDSEVFVDSE